MGGTKILSGSQSGIIAPRPAGPYPDISLAGKNPMSVALTERHHKSQDIYLLGKNQFQFILIQFNRVPGNEYGLKKYSIQIEFNSIQRKFNLIQ